jgi:hypothetical protein
MMRCPDLLCQFVESWRGTQNASALVWSNAPVIVGAHHTWPMVWPKNG